MIQNNKVHAPNLLRIVPVIAKQFRQTYPQYWQDKLTNQILKANRKNGIDEGMIGKVLAVKRSPIYGLELVIPGMNIVTNDGDVYYAQSAAAETPTDDFDHATTAGLRLGSAATAPVKTNTDLTTFLSGSDHVIDATYEQTNDGDADNTGAGTDIVTWRYSYLTSEGNVSGIQEGAIADDKTTPTAVLTHFLFAASFSKTSSDTLKVFVNHEFLGV